MMTRKHFVIIADTIKNLDVSDDTRKEIAKAFAKTLRATNGRFDSGRFVEHATNTNK